MSLTPVGFAALAHTRCAFIASGELPSNICCGVVEAGKYIRNLASEDKRCQALFLRPEFWQDPAKSNWQEAPLFAGSKHFIVFSLNEELECGRAATLCIPTRDRI